ETIETVLAPPSASRLLGSDATTPMLLLTRSSRDADGRPVEYVRSLYRGDRFRLTAQLTRFGVGPKLQEEEAAGSAISR
ncbi:MAG TPA: UTRA domain-containing protein, partial [Acidimicrobiia bacterium]